MAKFALVTEGRTDQIVIENILSGHFNTADIKCRKIQPRLDGTDENRTGNYGGWKDGGWTLVFKYCQSSYFKEICQLNDYVIIQIDTDVSEEKGYDVSWRDENGRELPPAELIQKVRERLIRSIGEEFFSKRKDKIIFAISVHSIECWLLPIYYRDNKKNKLVNCLGTLNQALSRRENFSIDPNNKNIDYYEKISKPYLKHKYFKKRYKENPSLEIFIEEIEKKGIVIEEDEDF